MMHLNIFILFGSFLFISFSVLGFCLLFEKISNKKDFGNDLGFSGLLGIFLLILYSYISHYFTAHNTIHNSIVLLIGFFSFIYLYKKILDKKNLIILLVLLALSFISLLIYKTHDDFHYYHFPYSYYLTQFPVLIGIGQFNHGFRTPSSIFYINSLFYIPIIKYYTFYISAVLFLVFSNLILIIEIIKNFKKKIIKYESYLCLLFLIFINIFFYRIQEHGTDRSAQILVLVLFLYLISFVNFKKNFEKNISKILILLGLIISLKALYIQYLAFSIPIFYILFKEKKFLLIIEIIKNKFFWLFLLLLFNVLFVYFLNTGCLIYPASFTCFDNFSWSLGIAEVDKMSIHYENWSKGGMTPISKVENPAEHIKKFNWFPNWIEIYFFNKVSDFIIGLLTIMVILTIIFYKKKKLEFNLNKNDYFILALIFLFFLEWLYNHPSLRYGGYCLIVILMFFPFSVFLSKFDLSIKEKKKRFIFLIFLIFLIFFLRNTFRINQEINKYAYKPTRETYYQLNSSHFRIDKRFNELIKNFISCENLKSDCKLDLKPEIKKFLNNRYIFKKN